MYNIVSLIKLQVCINLYIMKQIPVICDAAVKKKASNDIYLPHLQICITGAIYTALWYQF